jgi:chorismate mutase/prephenate dehydratase
MFLASPLKICGEVALRIHHHLMGPVEDLDAIQRVYSHQQSLAQCREWLDVNLPGRERIAVSSNAEAARGVMTKERSAAIAGDCAAELYGVPVLARNIEDDPSNTTRFLAIGHQAVKASGDDKTSLLVASRNEVGSLHRLLEPIARSGLTMTRIESRPTRRDIWEYVFFIDLDGHADESTVAQALDELSREATLFRVLGSFPKAVL